MKKFTDKKKKWIERTIANDRSYKSWLYNRFYLFALLVLAQLIVIIGLVYLYAYSTRGGLILQWTMNVLSVIVVLHLLNRHESPSMRLNWIVLILCFPIFGVASYIMYGEGRPARKMAKKVEQSKAEMQKELQKLYGERALATPVSREDGVTKYLSNQTGYPAYADGTVTYYKSGEEMFPKMLEDLRTAKKYILVEYFIVESGKMWNSILEILLEKAMEGVQIRILYDNFGCMTRLPPKYDRYLENLHENIKCMTFNSIIPVFLLHMNNRDHRKMIVIDGKIAFTGGVNLADEYINEKARFGYWKDTGIRVTGGSVRSFVEMFFYIWNAFRKDKERLKPYLLPSQIPAERFSNELRIQPYDDSPFDNFSAGETVYSDMIMSAKKYVYIFTPYLILNDFMRMLLCQAALRGVDVRIVTPAIPDKKMVFRLTRANYSILLKAGVKIYEYTPGFIHAKSMVCDDKHAVVGTINLDYRSLYLHFENAVYFSGCQAVLDVKRDCEETFAVSKPCSLDYPKRSMFGRLVDAVLRTFETLM